MTQPDLSPLAAYPWQGTVPDCRVYPYTESFQHLLRDLLGSRVNFTANSATAVQETVLVDCRNGMGDIFNARVRYGTLPVVAVLDQADTAQTTQALAAGPDGVIALADPVDNWLECLNVVRGGARWLNGPAVGVSLEQKNASYEISRRAHHSGEVTVRTRLFVQNRVKEKFRF